MNIDELLEDLEASMAHQRINPPQLRNLRPAGFEKVTFNRDHFAGFLQGSPVFRIVPYRERFATERGESRVSNSTLRKTCELLIGLWLRVQTDSELIQGKLLAVEGKLLIFKHYCLPLEAIRYLDVHAVDNADAQP